MLSYFAKVYQVNTIINLSVELIEFLNYTRDIKFDEKPDYALVKNLFKKLIDKEKIEVDYNYDWSQIKKPESVKCFNIMQIEVESKLEQTNKTNINTNINDNSTKVDTFPMKNIKK